MDQYQSFVALCTYPIYVGVLWVFADSVIYRRSIAMGPVLASESVEWPLAGYVGAEKMFSKPR